MRRRRQEFRNVKGMTLEELRQEKELLGPLIRDVIASKRARIVQIAEEIDRRSGRDGGNGIGET